MNPVAVLEELVNHDVSSSSDSFKSSSSSSNSSSSSSDSSTSTSSSTSNTSNDEDVEVNLLFPLVQHLVHGARRTRIDDFLTTVEMYTHEEFREHFRLTRRTAYALIGTLDASGFIPHVGFGRRSISAEWSFLITLWFFSNKEPLRTLSDRFDVSMSSVFRVIRRVVTWLLTLLNEKIRWPRDNALLATSQKFEAKRGIRRCIGAIDGTHIPIRQPTVNAIDYCNRKKYYSIILQAVVDADLRFTNVCCGEPGSLHDARVLRRSELYRISEENHNLLFPDDTFILGDSAYPSLPWLVPPFRNNGHLTAEEEEFNFIHSSTRMAVEKTFGVLKSRFRRLSYVDCLNTGFIPNIVLACCVLHNICIDDGDAPDWGEYDAELNELGNEGVPGNVENGGNDRRRRLFFELFPQALQR